MGCGDSQMFAGIQKYNIHWIKGTMKNSKAWRQLRRFGLEHCDFPTMIWNISLFFRTLTLNFDTRYKKRIAPIFYFVLIFCTACYYYTYLFSTVWVLTAKSPDTVTAMVMLSLACSSEMTLIKLWLMFIFVKKVRKMVDECMECDSLVVPGSRFHSNLMKALRTVKKRAMCFWIVIIVNAIAYILVPCLTPGKHLPEDYYIIYGLEPMFDSPNFEIAHILMDASVVLICYTTANITAFIIITAGYTEAQLLALSMELINVWEDATIQYYTDIDITPDDLYSDLKPNLLTNANFFINMDVKRRLVEIIKKHSMNIALLRQIEYVFRESMAGGFVFLIISLIGELLAGLEVTFLQIPFTLSQVAMDCFTGQRIMDASLRFERAVYNCKWENFDVDNMKIVLLMLQNSQKTLSLSAGGITVLSFSTLMSILRSVYTAYTTFRSK